ncbi:hypothetical protein B9Z19DRAFT_1190247 [Tuber borchii]|uniref:Uncharacterized protein n=1 Tax=Tuber borchii TaxID=42251 RepID=A0A2T7A4L3_TUBBO|nr:hypothetical protein B9Z19DRAFT_1190247 [Tuber borchii]
MAYHELVRGCAAVATTVVCAGFLYMSDKKKENAIITKIDQVEAHLTQGIYQCQQISMGSALVAIDKPAELSLMKERLMLFAACVCGNGGDNCFKEIGRDKGKGSH